MVAKLSQNAMLVVEVEFSFCSSLVLSEESSISFDFKPPSQQAFCSQFTGHKSGSLSFPSGYEELSCVSPKDKAAVELRVFPMVSLFVVLKSLFTFD